MNVRAETRSLKQKAPVWWSRKSVREGMGRFLVYLLLSAGSFLFLVPLAWMISTSFKANYETILVPIRWIPKSLIWDNYVRIFRDLPLALFFRNSLKIALLSTIGTVLSSSLVAYGFARLRAPGRDLLFAIVLSTMMLPGQVTLIPNYIIYKNLGWLDTHKALVIPSFLGAPFYIFLMRQFFQTISLELDDAARIDGCSRLGTYVRIILPLSKPVLGTVAIFSFQGQWSAFFWPLIILDSLDKYTIAIGLRFFRSMYATDYAGLMGATLLSMIPVLVLFFTAQKYFVQGIVVTGVKG